MENQPDEVYSIQLSTGCPGRSDLHYVPGKQTKLLTLFLLNRSTDYQCDFTLVSTAVIIKLCLKFICKTYLDWTVAVGLILVPKLPSKLLSQLVSRQGLIYLHVFFY